MIRTLSVSPQRLVVAPGYSAPPSEVEDLIAGRQRAGVDFSYQGQFMHLMRGQDSLAPANTIQAPLVFCR
jgi:hypothetical protein